MPTRANPFYQYRNPYLGNAFAGISEALFPEPDTKALVNQSAAAENMAQAQANYSLADERDQNARGKRIKNDRYADTPTALAELFLSGGRVQDDPLMLNPAYQAPAPASFDLLAQEAPPAQSMLSGQTAADKLAAALQQMEAYGFRPDQMMDAIGKMQYLGAAGGPNPQSGLPFAPFVGVTPNAGTALSPEAQGEISMRDSNESIAQALATAIQQGENSARVANINQAGATERKRMDIAADGADSAGGSGSGGTGGFKPSAIPVVTPTTAKAIQTAIETQAANLGLPELDPAAKDFLATEATKLYQAPGSPGFKNVQESVLAVLDRLASGEVDGVETVDERVPSWWRPQSMEKTKPVVKRKPSAPAAPAPARAAPPPEAIDYLRKNPNLSADFDRKYGQGASKQYLK